MRLTNRLFGISRSLSAFLSRVLGLCAGREDYRGECAPNCCLVHFLSGPLSQGALCAAPARHVIPLRYTERLNLRSWPFARDARFCLTGFRVGLWLSFLVNG